MRMHRSVTVARVMAAVQEACSSTDNPGFCLACGVDVEGVEPDAREYTCDECGADKVYGAEEVLIMKAGA